MPRSFGSAAVLGTQVEVDTAPTAKIKLRQQASWLREEMENQVKYLS